MLFGHLRSKGSSAPIFAGPNCIDQLTIAVTIEDQSVSTMFGMYVVGRQVKERGKRRSKMFNNFGSGAFVVVEITLSAYRFFRSNTPATMASTARMSPL
jgi:hypothetical protein